ncbi:hypothetical protein [Streptomyces katrae]|uniref:Uncharacterized protein n=1 Tax=Streptomyces katrae TaxID=68223 RepID=A0A0F4JRJ3_9ACTN|nr:hypothetical protein [Streptomyces katrae]KJY36444.1 hypothetical protein VR44_08005 [Streptomyces katrae]
MRDSYARGESITAQRHSRIMQKADAIQFRQRREDEETSVVLGRTSLAASLMAVSFAGAFPGAVISHALGLISVVPGLVTVFLRIKNRG